MCARTHTQALTNPFMRSLFLSHSRWLTCCLFVAASLFFSHSLCLSLSLSPSLSLTPSHSLALSLSLFVTHTRAFAMLCTVSFCLDALLHLTVRDMTHTVRDMTHSGMG